MEKAYRDVKQDYKDLLERKLTNVYQQAYEKEAQQTLQLPTLKVPWQAKPTKHMSTSIDSQEGSSPINPRTGRITDSGSNRGFGDYAAQS